MCLNCGCGDPANDRGNPANITIADLRSAAAANDQTLREATDHLVETVAAYERGGDVGSMPAAGLGASAAAAPPTSDPGLSRPAGEQPAPPAPRGTAGSES